MGGAIVLGENQCVLFELPPRMVTYRYSSANAKSKGKVDASMLKISLSSFTDANNIQRHISSLSHCNAFRFLWHFSYHHPRRFNVVMEAK